MQTSRAVLTCLQGLLLLVAGGGLVSSESDAVVTAACAALDRGQAAEAVYLLEGHAATAAWAVPRLLLARACTQAGRGQRAIALVADGSGDLAASWPRHLQGDAAFVLGEALIAAGEGARARPQTPRPACADAVPAPECPRHKPHHR